MKGRSRRTNGVVAMADADRIGRRSVDEDGTLDGVSEEWEEYVTDHEAGAGFDDCLAWLNDEA
jgi:hypothetical protein